MRLYENYGVLLYCLWFKVQFCIFGGQFVVQIMLIMFVFCDELLNIVECGFGNWFGFCVRDKERVCYSRSS